MSNKIVTAPLLVNHMDTDLESKTVYVFDYDNSQSFDKPSMFLDYINNVGVLSDILFTQTDKSIRFEILSHYMNSKHFNHILSLNIAIMNCIYKTKGTNIRLKGSALTHDMEVEFAKNNQELLQKWIEFFDSYLVYMIMFSTTKSQPIKTRYTEDKITNDSSLSPNIVSLFLDDFFYDYFKTGIDDNNVKYWRYYYNNKLYDNKPFDVIMLNDANFIIRILHNTASDNRWENYLKERFK